MSHVREILERALAECVPGLITDGVQWSCHGQACCSAGLTMAIREALAALDAEGVEMREALGWYADPANYAQGSVQIDRGDGTADDGIAVLEDEGACARFALSDISLPGQSPEPSAGLREAAERVRDMLRVRQALEPELTAADLAGRAADRLDAALRADEEQSHE